MTNAKDLKELAAVLSVFAVIMAIISGIVFGIGAAYSRYQCDTYSKVTMMEAKFEGQICYVKPNGYIGYIPYEEYKMRNITHNQ